MITALDISILLFIQEHLRSSVLTPFWRFITLFGNGGIFWICVTLLLFLIPRARRVGFTCTLSLSMGFLLTNVLIKHLAARPRPFDAFPEIIPLVARPTDYSFPSGHTCASFAVALVLLRCMPRKIGVPAVILASLVALSRLYLGVHYPSDVIAGLLIALLVSTVAVRITKQKSGNSAERER